MRKLLASVAIIFTLSGTAGEQDYDKGLAAFFASDYTAAMNEFRSLAELGYAEAQSSLGVMYESGLGVPQDNVLAQMWLSIAMTNEDEEEGGAKIGIA